MSSPGEQITSYLRLVRPLGEGGMGRLWVAEHQTLEIEVAVKLLNPDLAQDGQWLGRFRQEAHAVAKIDSAHVVRVFDHGTTYNNEPFIVMELLRGEDLLRRIERTNGLPLEEVELIVSQTCKALGRAHALGIIHRDLKPENIFLTSEGGELFVKLLDFGIAKHQTPRRMDLTDVNSVFGTPLYMSPEQALSASSVDHRADLWALSVVTFQMLTGSCPFVGPTPAAIGMRIQAGEFGMPSELRPGLPSSIDEWFKRALNRDIRARFGTADQLLTEFRRALQVRGTSLVPSVATDAHITLQGGSAARSGPALELTTRPKGRRLPGFAAAVTVVGVIVLGFLVGRGTGWRHAETTNSSPAASPSHANAASSGAHGEEPVRPESLGMQAEPSAAERDAAVAAIPLNVSSPPPAQSAHRAARGKNALSASATNPPTSSTTEQRPIKDRGF